MSTPETLETTTDAYFLEQLGPEIAPPPRPARILVAEDDPAMLSLLVWSLHEEGYEVKEARDGRELLRRLDLPFFEGHGLGGQDRYDLIVSDIRMPGYSGFEVLAALRARDAVTPVLLITAFGDQLTHYEAHSMGAAGVLDKPFDLEHFRAVVRRILSGGAPPPGPCQGRPRWP